MGQRRADAHPALAEPDRAAAARAGWPGRPRDPRPRQPAVGKIANRAWGAPFTVVKSPPAYRVPLPPLSAHTPSTPSVDVRAGAQLVSAPDGVSWKILCRWMRAELPYSDIATFAVGAT